MRTTKLLAAILVAGLTLSACQQDPDYVLPAIRVASTELNFNADTEQPLEFTATRDWRVRSKPDWVTVTPDQGVGSEAAQRVRITVTSNPNYNREGEIVLSIGLAKATVTISQPGDKGEVPVGTGTLEDPYTITGVLRYIATLGADVNSPAEVYITGKVATVDDPYGAQYGSGTFKIKDASGDETFQVYRAYYLGNKKWTENDSQIEVGDDVVVCGLVVNYKGNTPETVQNKAYLYSLNGVTASSGGNGGGNQNTDATVFLNNFDKEAATQTFGSGKAWPYLDQFEGWKNETGTGASAVTYAFANISARANSQSNSNYSDYDGSGGNNLFFGPAGNYLKIGNIQIASTTFTLSFGSEKYLNSGDSTFSHSEFHVYVSNDGTKWVELAYAFPNGDKSGRWDKASSTFSVPSGTSVLSLYFKADVASAYRLDDVALTVSSETGASIDFTTGISLDDESSNSSN